ncbi:sulfite exporter TauE/SafE family protein [Knoellia locipacati]|uniref:sulfite exporter TauE/SafE family protein n=1 Tax=Knoellia locipacati TaxID=882824 RepID=UPI003850BEC8
MSPLVIPLGLIIGLALGALGGGGSIITVPALVYLLGQEPGTATTSSLLIVGATSLIAVLPHARAGRVRVGQGLMFGALGTGGSYAGSLLASRVAPAVLLTAFAGLMFVVATVMLVRSRRGGAGDGPADLSREPIVTVRPLTCACPRLAKLVLTATGVGLLTGFFGVGGGFVLVPALVLALSFPMPVAVGTSLLVIAVNSSTALLARVSTVGADLDWPLIAGFTVAAVAGSLVGGRLASRLQPVVLTRAFASLVLVVATYTAASSLPALV